MKTSDLWIY